MCKDTTIMRMSAIEEDLLCALEAQASNGLENVSAAEMGAVVDMIKDFEEAKYYFSIVKAMHDDGEEKYEHEEAEEVRVKEAAGDHMKGLMDSMGKMWRDADQVHRSQMHSELVKFVNDLK